MERLIELGGLRRPGTVVANTGEVVCPEGVEVLRIGVDEVTDLAWDLVGADLVSGTAPIHDTGRLGSVLAETL